MSQILELDPQLNTSAVGDLFANLARLRGSNVTLLAGRVSFVGGLCFQVLLAARQQ